MDIAIGFTALSVNQLNALGSYKVPEKDMALFLALIREKKQFV
ncbi:hypothetical protein Bccel_0790 [Pseudobacteroides cellulosolvens ATCC 35603 = DSM 2933]|uniref:Uncharacterized protein n=1 Tax=Pseudobacteroides cellulosolvens ATCC 35603 = DSM 2933 TaxID=398512 RepID=A0A0L6JIH5_9FIRM|nr:hypothetical protein [Pseudobacteroides cellulosolvens]KNY25530.1 hypothetical protein Bccel_0790 [Pseudobacteroides cellulosolvens ATCC 35603 = DSM 2933]